MSRPRRAWPPGRCPVLRHWPGAETIYDTRWIHRTPADMAQAIAALTDSEWRTRATGRMSRPTRRSRSSGSAAAGWTCSPRTCHAAVPDPIYELLGTP